MTLFEQVQASFWDIGTGYAELPPLTQAAIADAERELGVTLPGEEKLLRNQNGGTVAPQWNACPAEHNFYAPDHVPFDHVFGIGPAGIPDTITMLDTAYLIREWNLPTPIVLLSGEGHYWIALDYRTCAPSGEPAVTWLDNAMEHEVRLSATFRVFVERLTSSDLFPQ